MAVVLRGFHGVPNIPTQPGTTFAKEIIDRVRVIACLDTFPNLIHSDAVGDNLLSGEWMRLKRFTECGEHDTLVITWGSPEDTHRAAEEIVIRAREATIGIPSETRQALSDGTNGFERILPGPDRMYPDTDLPPLAVTEEKIQDIRQRLPEAPWKKERRYIDLGITPSMARDLSRSPFGDLFERLVHEAGAAPAHAARYVTVTLPVLMKQNGITSMPNFDRFVEIIRAVVERGLDFSLARTVTEGLLAGRWADPNQATEEMELSPISEQEATQVIESTIKSADLSGVPPPKTHRYLMGLIIPKLHGRFNARHCAEILRQQLKMLPTDTSPSQHDGE